MACTVVGGAAAQFSRHGREANHLDLPPTSRAPALARHLVSETVGARLDPEQLSVLHLLISEVVTNGVLHGRTTLHVGVSVVDDEVLVTVQDGNDQLPPQSAMPPAASFAESGRGMALVSALAADYGWSGLPEGPGKVVWFTVRATAASAGRA